MTENIKVHQLPIIRTTDIIFQPQEGTKYPNILFNLILPKKITQDILRSQTGSLSSYSGVIFKPLKT